MHAGHARRAAVGFLAAIIMAVFVGQRWGAAQEDESPPATNTAVETTDQASAEAPTEATKPAAKQFRGRLPAYFSSVVTTTQRQDVYRIQEEYFHRLVALEEQIEKLKKERDEKVDAVLTPEQLTIVNERRKAAAGRRRSNASASVAAEQGS
jgi:hypothetical protein